MSPEARGPDTGLPPAALQDRQPGLIAGAGSIVAGLVGFGVPILGMIASCVGIWLGVSGLRRGRAGNYAPSVVCGVIGMSLSGLSIVYWLGAILFESHR